MIAFSKEPAFPSWAAYLLLLIPLSIMAFLLIRALVQRTRHRRVTQGPLSRRIEGVPLGSSGRIIDGGQVPWENLLEALSVAPETHGPGPDGSPWDEGWWGTMLGLRAKIASGVDVGAEPHILWGTRHGRQVFVRLGVDESGEGYDLVTNRGLRQIVVVRAAFSPFELRGHDGVIEPTSAGAPAPAVLAALAELDPSPDVWRDLQVVAGPEGIVTTRPQLDDGVNGWIYDLWLAEHLANATQAEPLLAQRIGPAWKVPYGVGRRRRRRSA